MEVVSVIIPVYNNEKYVEKCIRSVMGQTYTNLEILVIDDGSSDESPRILDQLAQEDERICLVHQTNGGVAKARNCGLDIAQGKYITFIDGDDYVCAEYIQNFCDRIQECDAEIIICGVQYVDENGKLLRELIPDSYQRMEKEEWVFRISAACSHFYRRELWEKYQVCFQSDGRGEDIPISLFFGAVCDKIEVLSKAGYFYVQHTDSAMHNFRGLKQIRLPYCALENTIKKIEKIGVVNSPEFYELFVLRILATFYFDLGRGASRKDMRELCDYIVHILTVYFPKYYRNKKKRLFSKVEVPFVQKAAVWILVKLVRMKILYPVSCLLSR